MSLQTRVVGILTRPAAEWSAVAAESHDVARLYTGYVIPLAAIGPVCGFISMTVFGVSVPLVGTYRAPMATILVSTVLQFAVALAVPYLTALAVNKLSPSLKTNAPFLPTLALIAYASTPIWVAGVLRILPMGLGLAALVTLVAFVAALYAIYLLYLGLPPMLQTSADQRVMMTAVIVVTAFVVGLVLGLIAGAISAPARPTLF